MSRIAYAKVVPGAFKAIASVVPYIDRCSIDKRLRALVELRVSQVNGCLFCIDMHTKEARHAGETQQRLDCLPAWREAPFYTEREKAALAWAESVTLVAETGAGDEEYERARAHFSETELVDLTLIIAMINAWNRLGVGFRQVPPQREDAAT